MNHWVDIAALFLILGGGGATLEALRKVAGGRRRNAALRAENKILKQQLAEANTRASAMLVAGPDGDEVAQLAKQTRDALDDRAELLDIVSRVQATDTVVPQLPQALRDDIDLAIERHRTRRAGGELALEPRKRKARKETA